MTCETCSKLGQTPDADHLARLEELRQQMAALTDELDMHADDARTLRAQLAASVRGFR